MYELKKNGKVFNSKSVGTGPSYCEKRIYRAAVSQRLRHTGLGVTRIFVTCGHDWLSLWMKQRGNYLQIRHIDILRCARAVGLFYNFFVIFTNTCD